ncbi:3-hydroxyacyl-[acyl-carrier-protein] dehydratase FabZ [Candidatus Clavichlamydia salmonicola]|uniref:3-hydroxyacyl-ACP dehydratase FabZ n=1 Tax=Candidatus Clavichlamydia salmonicola TaxID=469812 RepID=UPI001891119A|nr:3-hydroxyacyl-ACP dehydratase FabZ [Candidatus Clavichlamydia salmonicola]MBF5050746.1 3-hydroxyacyl-[acyl-carrier-protein] dehydratase FabZ [Candidatus Clavichlamydia salmonicola]
MNKTSVNTLRLDEIKAILPHRYPFLFLDIITHYDLEKKTIIGQKNVTSNEWFFEGHFPDMPIFPGVLLLEALAQTAGVLYGLISKQNNWPEKLGVFLTIDKAKFRRPVTPGDILELKVHLNRVSALGLRGAGKVYVGDELKVEADLGFGLINKVA